MGFALYCVCQTAYTQLKLRFGAQAKKVQPISTVLLETAEGVAAIAEDNPSKRGAYIPQFIHNTKPFVCRVCR